MVITCKNCGNKFEGKFCNQCGQSADVARLGPKTVWKELERSTFKVNRELWRTAKELFVRPGHMIREYIAGKRMRYIQPITMALVLAATHLFFMQRFGPNVGMLDKTAITTTQQISQEVNTWVINYNSWITLITLPLYSFISRLFFWKQSYNFFEHIALNAYAAAQRFYSHIVLLLIVGLCNIHFSSHRYMLLIFLIDISLSVWTYTQFFNGISRIKSALLATATYIMYTIMLTVLLMLFIIVRYGSQFFA